MLLRASYTALDIFWQVLHSNLDGYYADFQALLHTFPAYAKTFNEMDHMHILQNSIPSLTFSLLTRHCYATEQVPFV
jgi:hypothetical protein